VLLLDSAREVLNLATDGLSGARAASLERGSGGGVVIKDEGFIVHYIASRRGG